MDPRTVNPGQVPFAEARLSCPPPCTAAELKQRAARFKSASVADLYRGPAWVGVDGIACLIVICRDRSVVKTLRAQPFGFIGWVWNNTPSTYLSLTLTYRGSKGPYSRWWGPSLSPVVQAIRTRGRFRVTVATAEGEFCGWWDAPFFDGVPSSGSQPSRETLERVLEFPRSGIPYSDRRVPFHYSKKEPGPSSENEIELWAEPDADFWRTLSYEGPWAEDLERSDHSRAAWGLIAWRTRHIAAGVIETIRQELASGAIKPLLTAEGLPEPHLDAPAAATSLIQSHPAFGAWLSALAGPQPNATEAHRAALKVLNDPAALYRLFSELFGMLCGLHEHLENAMKTSFEAAALDSSVTAQGTARPWFSNTGRHGLTLQQLSIDLTSPAEKVRRLWSSGLELVDLIDSGLYMTGNDFPVDNTVVSEAMEKVVLEGSIEDAEVRIQALLCEAQQARQWSIPWGARVALNFGPFVAIRIFEREGEFACHFLDPDDQYFTVAIGIYRETPTLATHPLLRRRQDDGQVMYNEDAITALKLIAAAVIRDFLVVEERESVFGTRTLSGHRRARARTSVIYLPRVRYSAPSTDRLLALPMDEAPARGRHKVTQHLRRAKGSSPAQRFLAQSYGIVLPEGFTFVRAHERGQLQHQEQLRVYRSRSASRMLYEAVDVTPTGSRPAWFEFEKDCARLLRQRGMRVIHRAAHRDPDGGVDLFAVDEHEQAWVVQCKCWAAHREITPAIIRELMGAMELASAGSSSNCTGMVITTSHFSSGARQLAQQQGIEIVDGTEFATMLSRMREP